jgi:hypothetical protein
MSIIDVSNKCYSFILDFYPYSFEEHKVSEARYKDPLGKLMKTALNTRLSKRAKFIKMILRIFESFYLYEKVEGKEVTR